MDSKLQMNFERMYDACSQLVKTAKTTIPQVVVLEQDRQWQQVCISHCASIYFTCIYMIWGP